MNVLITGGTGLIGAHCIARLLAEGHTPHLLVRSIDKLASVMHRFNIELSDCVIYEGDLNDDRTLQQAMANCEALIHAAGLFSNRLEDRALMEQTNIEGTRKLLSMAKQSGLDPIIYTSSILALFPPPGATQTADDPVQQPSSVYASTKAAAERIARELQASAAPVVTIYPGAVQGPLDPTFGDGPKMIARYLRSGSVLVTEGGLVYTDVRDLARLICHCLQPGLGPRRFMFGGNYLAHSELHALLQRLTGRSDLKAQRFPASILRGMGHLFDLVSRLSGKSFPMSFEAASVLTRSVPCDDQPAIREFQLSTTSAEDSFRDLIQWMYREGKLNQSQAGLLAQD